MSMWLDLLFVECDETDMWLQGKPHEHVAVMAARAALRVFPALFISYLTPEKPEEDFKTGELEPFLEIFGATWGVCAYPTLWQKLADGIDPFERLDLAWETADGYARRAANEALCTMAAQPDAIAEYQDHYKKPVKRTPLFAFGARLTFIHATKCLDCLASPRCVAQRLFRKAVMHDAAQLQGGMSAVAVSGLSLWPDNKPPVELALLWEEFRQEFAGDGDAPLWVSWYENRLKGRARSRDRKLAEHWLDELLLSEQVDRRNRGGGRLLDDEW